MQICCLARKGVALIVPAGYSRLLFFVRRSCDFFLYSLAPVLNIELILHCVVVDIGDTRHSSLYPFWVRLGRINSPNDDGGV